MALGIIAAASGLISQGAKIWAGARQRKMAKELKKSDYVPSELTDNQDLAGQMAFSNRSFNQSVDEAETRKNIATTGYSMKQMAGGAARKLATTSAMSNRFMNNMARMRQRGRNARMNRVDRFMDANRAVGAVKMDNQRRYEAAKSALLGASMQNIYGGISDLPNTLGDILGTIDKEGWGGGGGRNRNRGGSGGSNTTNQPGDLNWDAENINIPQGPIS